MSAPVLLLFIITWKRTLGIVSLCEEYVLDQQLYCSFDTAIFAVARGKLSITNYHDLTF